MFTAANTRTAMSDAYIQDSQSSYATPPTRSKIVHIDSRFAACHATTANVPEHYVVELSEPLTNVSRMVIEEVDIPISYYNISATLGNHRAIFVTTNGESSYTVTVPDGYYTAASLATAFVTQVNAFVTDITISTTISAVQMVTIQHIDGSTPYYIKWGEPVNTNQCSYTLGHILGFRLPRSFLSVDGSIIGTAPCLMNTIMPYLFLAVDDYSNTNQTQILAAMGGSNSAAGARGQVYLSSEKIMAKITVPGQTNGYGDRIVATTSTGFLTSGVRVFTTPSRLWKLKFTWIDVMGNPVALNQVPFSVCLRIDCA